LANYLNFKTNKLDEKKSKIKESITKWEV